MIGWKAKVGLLLPSRNVIMEPDCYAFGPEGISFHSSRMRRDKDFSGAENNRQMIEYAREAAELVAQANVDLIVFGCTSASFINGPGSDIALADSLSEHTGIPVLTIATAVTDALHAMDCKRISIITPYIDEINKHEITFFEGIGFTVTKISGMGIGKSSDVPKVSPAEIYHFVRTNASRDCDAIFISCTNFRAMEVLEAIETDLQIPVIVSNQAILWRLCKLLGVNWDMPGCGALQKIGLK